ncbi:hypothetical protein ACRRVD_03430 [Candidatus Cardinium hertigii]
MTDYTLLKWAGSNGKEVVRLLIDKGVHVNARLMKLYPYTSG